MALPSMGGITQLGEGLNKKVKKFELTLPGILISSCPQGPRFSGRWILNRIHTFGSQAFELHHVPSWESSLQTAARPPKLRELIPSSKSLLRQVYTSSTGFVSLEDPDWYRGSREEIRLPQNKEANLTTSWNPIHIVFYGHGAKHGIQGEWFLLQLCNSSHLQTSPSRGQATTSYSCPRPFRMEASEALVPSSQMPLFFPNKSKLYIAL